MSTTQPPAGHAPGGGPDAGPAQRHPGPAPAASTTARRDLPDKVTPAHPQHRSPARPARACLTPQQQPATAASPAATGPTAACPAAGSQISARLPVSDWQIQWRRQPDGRTILEVTDQAGNLTGLVASTRLPIVSVDAAWRGTRRRHRALPPRRLPHPGRRLGTPADASHPPATLNSGPDTRAQRNHKPGPRHLLPKPGATKAGSARVPG